MLALLLVLIVLMPVSYRAGTDSSHPHTIFQSLIDMAIGQPHHDHPWDGANHAGAGNIVGAAETSDHGAAERLEPNLASPDMPTVLGLSSPIDATASIHALGALVAAILSGSGPRSIRDAVRTLSGLIPALEPPPPRLA